MAKHRMKNTLIEDDLKIPVQPKPDDNGAVVAEKPGDVNIQPRTVVIELPVRTPTPGAYRTTHVDVQLDEVQKEALKSVFDGLNGGAYRLQGGRFVQHTRDVVKYIFEQIALAIK